MAAEDRSLASYEYTDKDSIISKLLFDFPPPVSSNREVPSPSSSKKQEASYRTLTSHLIRSEPFILTVVCLELMAISRRDYADFIITFIDFISGLKISSFIRYSSPTYLILLSNETLSF